MDTMLTPSKIGTKIKAVNPKSLNQMCEQPTVGDVGAVPLTRALYSPPTCLYASNNIQTSESWYNSFPLILMTLQTEGAFTYKSRL